LDPSPRKYAPIVKLVRRSNKGATSAPQKTTYRDIENWFLNEALQEKAVLELFESFVWRVVAAGSSLERASLHIGTLHPQLLGFAWNWSLEDGLCDEVQVAAEALSSDAYRKNPLYRVVAHGEHFQANLYNPESPAPLLRIKSQPVFVPSANTVSPPS